MGELPKLDPALLFERWLKRQNFQASSKRVYRSMWEKFSAWLARHAIELSQLSAERIDQFLNENKLVKHHRYRYVRLIERVLDDEYRQLSGYFQAQRINPASVAAYSDVGRGANDPTAFFRLEECERLISYFDAPKQGTPTQLFKQERDAAMAALALGAGAKVFQLQQLSAGDLRLDEQTLIFPPNQYSPAPRSVLILPFALPALARWQARRQALDLPPSETALFLSTSRGGVLHVVTIFRRIHKLLLAAQVVEAGSPRAAPQTLRNTYAALRYMRGDDKKDVARDLGFIEPSSSYRFYQAFLDWQEREALQAQMAQ